MEIPSNTATITRLRFAEGKVVLTLRDESVQSQDFAYAATPEVAAMVVELAEPADRFHASPEYLALTTAQRLWVDAFIVSRDPFQATAAAYHFASDRDSKQNSYHIKANLKVQAALNLYLGKSVQDAANERTLVEVQRNLKAAEAGSTAAQRLLAQQERLIRKVHSVVPSPKPQTPSQAATPQAAPPQIAAPGMAASVTAAGDVAIADAQPKPKHVFHVGEHAWGKDGVEHIVTAVDECGDITAAEKVEK